MYTRFIRNMLSMKIIKVSDELDINIEYQIRKDGQTYLQWLEYEKLNFLEGNYKGYRYFVHTDAFDKVRKYSSVNVDVFTDDNQMVTIWYISPFSILENLTKRT